jgi:hypothetical protein
MSDSILSDYDLSCGKVEIEYIQKSYPHLDYQVKLELYKEHNAFHVKVSTHYNDTAIKISWNCFDTYEEATTFYQNIKRGLN